MVHPRLINSCSWASASWLTTLLSTCITTNNFCMRIIHIPDSVLVCFGYEYYEMLPHDKERLSALANSHSISYNFGLCHLHFHYLPATHSPFNSDYFSLHFIVLVPVIWKSFMLLSISHYVWRWIVVFYKYSSSVKRREKNLTKSRRKQEVWVF